MFQFCWQQNIPRWDLFLEEMPAYAWDGWERWMAKNPDHPAHRDQLLCDIAALLLKVQDCQVTPKQLMEFRLRDPSKDEA